MTLTPEITSFLILYISTLCSALFIYFFGSEILEVVLSSTFNEGK